MTGREVRLKYVSSINDRTLPEETDPETRFRYVDISAVSQGRVELPDEQINFGQAPSRARRMGYPGDTIVSTVRTYLRAVAEIPSTPDLTVFSTGFAVVHPDPDEVYPRFLTYQLQGERFITSVEAISTGVSYPATTAADVGNLPVWLPDLHRQRAITTFLDRETAQIDAMIAKQEELVGLLGERREATRTELLQRAIGSAVRVPLKYLSEVTVGIVITPSRWYADEGVVALRGLNVRSEAIDLTDTVKLTPEGDAVHSKSRLRSGDVVVVRTGQAGAAAEIPPELDGANAIDLLLVRPGPALTAGYLSMFINSFAAQEVIREGSVGALQAHFNVSALKGLPVPLVNPQVQIEVVAEWRERADLIDATVKKAQESIELMRERRAALISDAVTGRLNIEAYGRGRPEEGVA